MYEIYEHHIMQLLNNEGYSLQDRRVPRTSL